MPKAVRVALGVGAGDRVRYLILDGEVRIRPVGRIERLFGALRSERLPATLDDMERGIAEGATGS